MSAFFRCPYCDRLLSQPGPASGRAVVCPACRGEVAAPSAPARGVVLSPVQLLVMLVVFSALVVLSFTAGLALGRWV
jgi:hypothetical protein